MASISAVALSPGTPHGRAFTTSCTVTKVIVASPAEVLQFKIVLSDHIEAVESAVLFFCFSNFSD
jgi:hypothetical protein